MASLTQLTAASNAESLKCVEKKRVLNGSSSSTTLAEYDLSLPSSSRLHATPYGKTHAGEVRRRTDRQTGPLSAPGLGQSGSGDSTNDSSQRPRRQNGSNNGGYDSDSDSDDERKRRKSDDNGDDNVVLARPVPRYAENLIGRPAVIDMVDEEQFHRSMQYTLALVEKELAHYASPSEQRQQMHDLDRLAPAGMKPDAIRSETYGLMLDYYKALEKKIIEEHTTTLMRYLSKFSSYNWLRPDVFSLVRQGKVTFKYVQLGNGLPCVMELPRADQNWRFRDIELKRVNVVLRVILQENTPRYAEIVHWRSLIDLGWYVRENKWCHDYVKWDKSSGNKIYEMDMTGRTTKLWDFQDFQDFLERRRALPLWWCELIMEDDLGRGLKFGR